MWKTDEGKIRSEGEMFTEQEGHNSKMQPIPYSMFIKHITEQAGLRVTLQRRFWEMVGTAATMTVVLRAFCQYLDYTTIASF
jgi:hypothetical protein